MTKLLNSYSLPQDMKDDNLWVVEFSSIEGNTRYICEPKNGWYSTGYISSAKKYKTLEDATQAAKNKLFGNPRVVTYNKKLIKQPLCVDWEITETFLHDNEPIVEE